MSRLLVAIAWRPRATVKEPRLVREHDCLDAVTEVELLEDVRDVCLDGRVADVELSADLNVREAAEMDGPNISVYPDSNQVGIFDAAKRSETRFAALFDVGAAISGYGGGSPTITPPAPGPTSETGRREGT